MSETAPEVSVVMPCLDEAETIAACIEKARTAIERHDLRAEIVVADNGSVDGSPAIARACGARCISEPTRGYGAALMAGIRAAEGSLVVMGDADDTYDFSAIHRFIAELRAGADLVVGCRLPSGGGTIRSGAMPWSHRWIGVPLLSATARVLFGGRVRDFHCGLRAFRREAVLALDLRATGMEFASEMLIRGTIAGLRITEVPVTLSRGGRSRRPHLRAWRDGWRHLLLMLRCAIDQRRTRALVSRSVPAPDEIEAGEQHGEQGKEGRRARQAIGRDD